MGDIDRQGGGEHLGLQLLRLLEEVGLEQGGDEGVGFARQIVPAGTGAEEVRQGGRQPVAELRAGAAVERLDERLAVLVVPEANARGLTAGYGAGGGWA